MSTQLPGNYSPQRALALTVIRLGISDRDWSFFFDRGRERVFAFWCEVAGTDPEAIRDAVMRRRTV